MPRDGHSPGAAASERSVNASESRHRSRRRLRGRLRRHVPGPGDPRMGDAMPAHTRASRVLPRPGSPLVADAMPVDPTCKPRPGSRRSADGTRPAGAHTGAVPSRVPAVPRKEACAQPSFPHPPLVIPAFAGIQGRGRAVCLPPPCSPATLPYKAVAPATANKQTPFLPPFQLQKPRQKKQETIESGRSTKWPRRRTGRASVAPGPPFVDSASRRVQTTPSGGGCRRGRCEGYRSS